MGVGFVGKAQGAFGVKETSPWSEGSTGLTKAVEGWTQQAINSISRTEPAANFSLYVNVDGTNYQIRMNKDTTPQQLAQFLIDAGCRENVIGFVTQAITAHCQTGVGPEAQGVKRPLFVDITT